MSCSSSFRTYASAFVLVVLSLSAPSDLLAGAEPECRPPKFKQGYGWESRGWRVVYISLEPKNTVVDRLKRLPCALRKLYPEAKGLTVVIFDGRDAALKFVEPGVMHEPPGNKRYVKSRKAVYEFDRQKGEQHLWLTPDPDHPSHYVEVDIGPTGTASEK